MNDGTEASSFRTLPRESPRRARSLPLGPDGRDEAPRIVVNIANLPELPQRKAAWAKRVGEPPTAAATAAWSRADRFGPAPERGHKA